MTSLPFAVLIVGASAFAAVVGMLIVRRMFSVPKLQTYHDVSGNMLAVVGSMYALLVALIVVDAMTNLQQARATTELEANSLADVFRLADGFPDQDRLRIQKQCFKYSDLVVNSEWLAMEDGKHSEPAYAAYQQLWKEVERTEPVSEQQKAFFAQMVAELSSVGDSRRSRLLAGRHGISPLLWFVLAVGAGITVLLTYFFAVDNVKVQSVMIGAVAITIALNLFLIAEYAHPFTGTMRVQPDAFRSDITFFEAILKDHGDKVERLPALPPS